MFAGAMFELHPAGKNYDGHSIPHKLFRCEDLDAVTSKTHLVLELNHF